jgi:acyl-CoA thioesterase
MAQHSRRWAPTSLVSLLRALDLRPVGPQRFEMTAAERQWPAFPAAQLAAAAVVAAERCFPGCSVSHLSCAYGQPAGARVPLTIAMTEVRADTRCVTARLEFDQGGIGHGEAAVVLQPDTAGARAVPPVPAGQAAPSPDLSADDVTGLHPPLAWLAPWELRMAPVSAGPRISRPGSACIWSRLSGRGSEELDGTAGRALLAYLSELLPLAAAAAPSVNRGQGGRSSNVLSHAITYDASFNLRDWLMATVDSYGADQGYVHARATFRTHQGAVAAVVSQAAAVRGGYSAMPGRGRAEQGIA